MVALRIPDSNGSPRRPNFKISELMATIYRTLLAKGYFPKELPPSFVTEHFAQYATSHAGRATIAAYRPANSFTECVTYELALPGGGRRSLGLPHPGSYATLALLVAQAFRRLLKKAAGSKCTRSRPIYVSDGERALRPSIRASNLGRERAVVRGGARYVLKVDISQFYPSLYTHAIGWAIDPKLRKRANWKNSALLGKRIDQALMDLQGKISHGIPIGNDISFLLAEVVLAEVDKTLRLPHRTAVRWFDDYEIACSSIEEAERWLARLQSAMTSFRLKLNPAKTKIIALPDPALDGWQTELVDAARRPLIRPTEMLGFFDRAFRLRAANADAPVLNYALGLLFRLRSPGNHVASIAQSAITQAILAEPGSAQKGLALLTYWRLNGLILDEELLARTISQMIVQQRHRGFSSDVSWGLFFCLQQNLTLSKRAVESLASCDDNCILLQALQLRDEGLLPKTFESRALATASKQFDIDGPDWLLHYEAHRQKFTNENALAIASHSLFADLLKQNIAFYRRKVPAYAAVIHPGGAPEWVVASWLKDLREPKSVEPTAPVGGAQSAEPAPVVSQIAKDIQRLAQLTGSNDEVIARLLDIDDEDKPSIGEEADVGMSYPV
jgi:hypothetical protein